MKHLKKFPLRAFFYFLVGSFFVFSFFYNQSRINGLVKKVKNQHQDIISLQKTNVQNYENVLKALIAQQVSEIVRNIKGDEEKCVAVAKYIAGHISNRDNPKNSLYRAFAARSGLCGYRARLFVEMLQYLNIPAMVFNIYNYPSPGGGHSCAQAYYDGTWHFFDVTYAGYFKKSGNILSFKQIMEEAQKRKHFEYLVVFDETIDTMGEVKFQVDNHEPVVTISKSDNDQRMRYYYENIQKAKTFGFFKHPAPKNLFIDFDFSKYSKNFSIGDTMMDYMSLGKIGVQEKLTENIGLIGTCTDNFQQEWNFKNLESGRVYTMRLFTYRTSVNPSNKGQVDDKNFFVKTDAGVTVLDGEFNNPALKVWTIKFKALKKQAKVSINYRKSGDFNTSCLLVNKITID